MNETVFSLYELNRRIREAIYLSFPETYLITAEIASIRCDNKGHCYVDLIEKDDTTIIAQMGARIWASTYKILSDEFQKATGINLSKGLKILLNASLNFHERYGLSLIIHDIDPSYTIGEMARKRKEIIDRLTKEGILDRNKKIPLPLVPQKIAVISSRQAAGYEDFINHLDHNPYGYSFSITFHESSMQGDRAEISLLNALSLCERDKEGIDVIAIVRGGGAKADLDCFDSYDIGKKIALMPLPVIVGIGHERDKTVMDEVSHTSVKTPTAAAGFLIDRLRSFEDTIDTLSQRLLNGAKRIRENNLRSLMTLSKFLETTTKSILIKNRYRIDLFSKSIFNTKRFLNRQNSTLSTISEKFRLLAIKDIEGLEKNLQNLSSSLINSTKRFLSKEDEILITKTNSINHLNPLNVLRRGYSITCHDHKALKSADNILKGDTIKTLLYKGKIESKVTSIKEQDIKTTEATEKKEIYLQR